MPKSKTITFNTKGYDGFIDFIKAYAILCVLFGHTFGFLLDKVAYGVWAGMQVPFFVLIQTFHSYKKDKVQINIAKVFKRVMIPFFLLELITFLIALCIHGNGNINLLITRFVSDGGYGPGSYYPWVYLQIAILLPCFTWILVKCNKVLSLIIFLLICEGLEIAFSHTGLVSESLYRLLAVRYFFLFYLGWLWVQDGIKINWVTILLSFISLVSIIYFEYFSLNDEPWFFTTGWSFHRWPCYFFVAYGLTSFLYIIYKCLCRSNFILKFVKILASATYEIFLIQMSLIFLFQPNILTILITSELIRKTVWIFLVWVISIWGGILLNRLLYIPPKRKIEQL